MTQEEPSLEDVRAQLTRNTNWGRWGEDDERGAVNMIDDRKRVEAAALVRSGRTISLSRDFPKNPAPNNLRPAQHFLRMVEMEHGGYLADYLGVDCHGTATTHLDALCHVWNDGVGWNGRSMKDTLTPAGVTWGGIEHWRDGISTRAVLFDVPAFRGTPHVTVEEPVHGEELRAIADKDQLDVRPGDALIIYSGRAAYEAEHGPWGAGQPERPMPGIHASCLWYLRETDCAVVVWDMADARPQSYDADLAFTVHGAIAAYGLAVVDNAVLEPLAAACAGEQRHEFMLTLAPLPTVGGTGSPVNPIALL